MGEIAREREDTECMWLREVRKILEGRDRECVCVSVTEADSHSEAFISTQH